MKSTGILAAAVVASVAQAQSPLYGQCGGISWQGATTCENGAYCSHINDFYWQCLPGTASSSSPGTTAKPTSAIPTTARTTLTTATRTTSGTVTTPPAVTDGSNPIAGKNFYANPYYSSEIVNLAVPSLIAAGSSALAAKASKVAEIGTFHWLDVRAKVPTIAEYAKDVQAKNKAGANLVLPLVVYDLPDRDCAALASNGELSLDKDGANLYKKYINDIAAQIKAFPDVFFVLSIEPDSLANLITNLNVAKCANAASAYKELTIYAIKTLDAPNVVQYMDAGHAGWLGWPANITPAAKLYAQIYKDAGSPKSVRGLVTNVSNYNAWSLATCPAIAESNTNCDEKKYINAIAPLLRAEGFPAHFLVDTSRSGKQPTGQQVWGDWCNVKGAGFGIRPSTKTDDPLLDAWVWVKPGGEGDGTSDTSAVRYDAHCGVSSAMKPAPEAGSWFQDYFVMLLQNASPAF